MNWTEAVYHRAPTFAQNWLLSQHGRRLRKMRFDSEYLRLRQEFLDLEHASGGDQLEYQRTRLSSLMEHCYQSVAYYRKIFDARGLCPKDVQQPSDLLKLPVLTKEALRANFDQLLAADVSSRKLRLGNTSGTTGTPLSCYWDRSVDRATNAALWAHRSWADFEFGRPYASLLGRMVVPPGQKRPPYWRYNQSWKQLFLSSFHLEEESADSYLAAMADYQVEALEAYPSTAYLLARYLQASNQRFPLRAVFTSAETLLPIQRQVIESRFSCRVYDYFGQAERVLFAGECSAQEGLHLFAGYGITEITDDEGQSLPSGSPGHLTVTGLHNFAMPLIRYRLGDVSAILTRECSCCRKLPLMHPVTTKAEDVVVTPEGRYISSSVLTHPFKPMKNIQASQIIQEQLDHLLIKIVPRPDYTERDSVRLVEEFRKRVGDEIRIEVELVTEIPRSSRGKMRWVISKVPLRFGAETLSNLHWHQDEPVGGEETPDSNENSDGRQE